LVTPAPHHDAVVIVDLADAVNLAMQGDAVDERKRTTEARCRRRAAPPDTFAVAVGEDARDLIGVDGSTTTIGSAR